VESCGLPDGINKLLIMALVEQEKKTIPIAFGQIRPKKYPKIYPNWRLLPNSRKSRDFCGIVESLNTLSY
jgi:hypothetical protein